MNPSPDFPFFSFRSGVRTLVVLLALALGTAVGCAKAEKQVREKGTSEAPAATSEAAKTRALEEKAAEYKDRYQEIQESAMTAEEKAQAASELVDEQQRTVREAEDGAAGDEAQQ